MTSLPVHLYSGW